jgi:Tfp pilus assembly protein PilX
MTEHQTCGAPARQSGAVLIIALIVLVAMTLSALSLMRSVNATNLIAGNLAFHESAVLSAESATESALSWLIHAQEAGLYTDKASSGYLATRTDPNWETYWSNDSSPQVRGVRDVAGNRVDYVIHRLCGSPGAPLSDATRCAKPPINASTESRDVGKDPFWTGNQVYYRITSRVTGPRNTVVYTQTIVAL